MAKRPGRPPNVSFEQMLGRYQEGPPKRAPASGRKLDQYLADMNQHAKDFADRKLSLNEYGAKRRDTMNAYQMGKPPYQNNAKSFAFGPKKDD